MSGGEMSNIQPESIRAERRRYGVITSDPARRQVEDLGNQIRQEMARISENKDRLLQQGKS